MHADTVKFLAPEADDELEEIFQREMQQQRRQLDGWDEFGRGKDGNPGVLLRALNARPFGHRIQCGAEIILISLDVLSGHQIETTKPRCIPKMSK